ncbi:uncharacterized protein F5Z01DRAFT_176048 [Emericellopsis atlantica]|uniref:Zn(2)-C6 fungal-type domain-containing protein n=1 Tax=Emericellopsis atlantica TaxID=2614577 RepID=A0A9P7ZK22_9HYPO|nr:uncharacterized protein F5Z01DRAFT_176048 [Emericellopsis atlantica]KAG9253161.1 hypothetical protein F5Z01DRAFT_176048 [Emericellopsis atlantica]
MSVDSAAARPRLAACIVCRRSKIKCDWTPGEVQCKRCIQLGKECVRPDVHVGRQKGIKNKRVGLDKALYQIEQVVRRGGSGDTPQSGDGGRIVARLKELLDEVQAREHLTGASARTDQLDYQQMDESSDADPLAEDGSQVDSTPDMPPANADTLAIDDAENPLQLLARASYFQPPEEPRRNEVGHAPAAPLRHQHQQPPPPTQQNQHTRQPPRARQHTHSDKAKEACELQQFFGSAARVNLDVGDDIDPLSMGLVTVEEGEALFRFFYDKLAHTRWGLDPRLYTLSYTRSRSAFLCTSIMAAAALFWPSAGALSKRLSTHAKMLANRITPHRLKSVEIVLAYLINVPWMFPGSHSTNDETSAYISMATTIAIDLSLHKVLIPQALLGHGTGVTVARGECLDPKTALAMDGFQDVDPLSEQGTLLLRGRERCWISLFVLERGMCLARGRPFLVPITRLLKDCDNWHKSPLAEKQDGPLLSMAVLRRDLDATFATVRAYCDGTQGVSSDGSLAAQSIESTIESFFDQWYANWGAMIGAGPERRLPPYVEILVTHTRLSIYGSVINHPTAPLEVRRFFRTAGLSSALAVLRTAIQGEAQLQSMPNNTTIMISFAACFALTLSAYTAGGSTLAPSVRKLIDETASVLERIGAVTEHRNGLSSLYGRHLRQIVRRAAKGGIKEGLRMPTTSPSVPASLGTPPIATGVAAAQPMDHQAGAPLPHQHHPPLPQQQQQLLWPETLQFSTMSDDQIMQVLNQPGNDFEPSFGGLSWDDMSNFDWLHWPEFAS